MGVAGPANVATLLRDAAHCGIGNSVKFLKKRSSAITQLTTSFSPEVIVEPIANAWAKGTTGIEQIHVYPFGGLEATTKWLREHDYFKEHENNQPIINSKSL